LWRNRRWERKAAILRAINSWLKHFAFELQRMFFFSLRTSAALFQRPFYGTETIEQMYNVGVGSLFLVILTGMFAGQGLAYAFAVELAELGAKNYLGRIMAIAVVRELGPLLAALMIAARVSSGITAELGAMKSSHQIDAMVAFGVDPRKKLIVPRIIALLVMVPVLTVVTDVLAILGGYIVGTLVAHLAPSIYWAAVKERLVFGNLFIGLLKPVVFSVVIALVSTYKGFTAEGGTKGVGRATTESVMISSITILVVNFFISRVVFATIKGWL